MAHALHAEPTTDDRPLPAHTPIAIIGAGFAGMGMGIRLLQSGVEDFVIMERDSDVGGTWSANTYPGCQCDIPSHLYSFSFAPNPDWTRTYPKQPELRAYLRKVAERLRGAPAHPPRLRGHRRRLGRGRRPAGGCRAPRAT